MPQRRGNEFPITAILRSGVTSAPRPGLPIAGQHWRSAARYRSRVRRDAATTKPLERLPDRRPGRSARWHRPRCCCDRRQRRSLPRQITPPIRPPHGRREQESMSPVRPAAPSLNPVAGQVARERNIGRRQAASVQPKGGSDRGKVEAARHWRPPPRCLRAIRAACHSRTSGMSCRYAAEFRQVRSPRRGRGWCRPGWR